MNKKYVKRIIGIILLAAVLVASFFPLQEYFSNRITHNQVRIKGFYLEKKNSLDVIVMGSSEVYYDADGQGAFGGGIVHPVGVEAHGGSGARRLRRENGGVREFCSAYCYQSAVF